MMRHRSFRAWMSGKPSPKIVGEIQTIERKLDGFAAFHREQATLTNPKFDGFR